MLTEAADLLVKAQEREDLQFAAAQPERGKKTHAPLQPRVLQRTPTSCTLTNFPFNLKGGKRVARCGWGAAPGPYARHTRRCTAEHRRALLVRTLMQVPGGMCLCAHWQVRRLRQVVWRRRGAHPQQDRQRVPRCAP